MAVTYNDTVKNARLQVVADAIDQATDAGTLEIGTAGMAAVLATITLATPPEASITGGVLTFTMPQSDPSADNTGTAAAARIRDGAGTDIITGLTVGTSGTDIIVSTTAFAAGQTITIDSATITHG